MENVSLPEILRSIDAANSSRHWLSDAAKRKLEKMFPASCTLAVYGTLAPGRPNFHVLEPLGGEWTDGLIEGDLVQLGWGSSLGYPRFQPRVGGEAVEVNVLTSSSLTGFWPELDNFEGSGYERILVPIFDAVPVSGEERRLQTVANLYAAVESGQ